MKADSKGVNLAQALLLALVSLLILAGAPEAWDYSPDAGVYVGSALSLVEEGRYWFNGHPNLLYYPGTSLLAAIPISVFGLNFPVINLFFALLGVAGLWIARAVFHAERWGWPGVAVPLLLGVNYLFVEHSHTVVSDVIFVDLVLLATYCWQRFSDTEKWHWYLACLLVVAVAPMFRFHGLLLIAAFGLALIWRLYQRRRTDPGRSFAYLIASASVFLPFVLWTARNYILHTPDTYSMANRFFFGLEGLAISGPGFGTAYWVDAAWKFPAYQLIYLFGGLAESAVGDLPGNAIVVGAAATMLLLAVGTVYWLPRAGFFAATFVLLNVALMLNKFVGGDSLYIVVRYWLPVLPFLILIGTVGFSRIATLAMPGGRKQYAHALGATAFAVVFALGAAGLVERIVGDYPRFVKAKYEAATTVGEFVRSETAGDAVVMTTDWGVGPFVTDRLSYQIARSPCMRPTLELLLAKGAGYLVITPKALRNEYALALVNRFPEAFRQVFELKDEGHDLFGAVYSIDRDRIRQTMTDVPSVQECLEEQKSVTGVLLSP